MTTRNRRGPREATIKKTLAFLWDVKRKLENEVPRFNYLETVRSHHVSEVQWRILLAKGIVKDYNPNRGEHDFRWESRDPSESMAIAVINETNDLNQKWRKAREAKKAEALKKEMDDSIADFQKSGVTNVGDIEVDAEVVEASEIDNGGSGDIVKYTYSTDSKPYNERVVETTTYFGIFKIKRVWESFKFE